MAKFTIGRGLDDYIDKLNALGENANQYIGKAIFEGAKIVADEIHARINALPIQDGPVPRGSRRDPTQEEVTGMLEGLGIARKRITGGFANVKIGMDGYNSYVTEDYPKGHPNAMVARSINAGTSFIKRYPFVKQAVDSTRAEAEERMAEVIENSIAEKMQ